MDEKLRPPYIDGPRSVLASSTSGVRAATWSSVFILATSVPAGGEAALG
jgi:hypothetical protein